MEREASFTQILVSVEQKCIFRTYRGNIFSVFRDSIDDKLEIHKSRSIEEKDL